VEESSVTIRPNPADWVFSWLRSPTALFISLAILSALHVVVRVSISPVADLDEAEQLVFTQAWHWGYGSQAPLYTWLQILTFKLTGPSIFGLALLKNLLLFATCILVYWTGREMTQTHTGASLATVSLLFIPQFAYESHRDLTHSVAVTAIAAATLLVFFRLRRNYHPGWYFALGGLFGLGLLAKYNYALVIAGLLLAGVAVKEFRPLIVNPWLVVAAAIAAIMVWPHAAWALDHKAIALSATHKLHVQENVSVVAAAALGLGRLLGTLLLHLISIVLVFAVLARRQLWPLRSGAWREPDVRFLWMLMAAAIAVSAALVLGSGATSFKGRWLQPIYLCAPLICAALVHERMNATALRRLIVAALFVAVGVLIFLPMRVRTANRLGYTTELHAPFPSLGLTSKVAVDRADLIVADTAYVGGNLRLLLPAKPVITPQFFDVAAAENGTCLAAFNATHFPRPGKPFKQTLGVLGTSLTVNDVHFVSAPYPGHRTNLVLGVALLHFDHTAGSR
jgi:4-amino-4-deoxy-L-arabinose transferase-like glycosyltransferase